jgi:hypothetical protein
MQDKYQEFLRITKSLNQELNITPVFFGSLGLSILTNKDLDPQDIDVLVPQIFLKNKWPKLKQCLEELGYELVDLHEHEFVSGKSKIGIGYEEDLMPFAGIDYAQLAQKSSAKATYKYLSLMQYLAVYSKSLTDSYRASKNNQKDQLKIDLIKEMIGEI